LNLSQCRVRPLKDRKRHNMACYMKHAGTRVESSGMKSKTNSGRTGRLRFYKLKRAPEGDANRAGCVIGA
jgi:hypothetical protein